MMETIFLFALALVWIIFAVVQDLRKREIADWLNFSLIVFALGFRFFYSLFSSSGFNFFYQGLLGLGIFFLLGNILYYGKMFAGGDAKLMIALGAVLPMNISFLENTKIFLFMLLIFFLVGAFYTIITSLILGVRHWKKLKFELLKQFKIYFKISFVALVLAIVLAIAGLLLNEIFVYLAIFLFILPYVYIYAKAIDESCMIRKTRASELTEGDWLYRDVKVKGKTIKATWDGLSKQEIKLLRKSSKSVLIRHGVPFSPVFLISFLIFILAWKNGILDVLF